MKRHFDDDLRQLNERILEMASLTEAAIAESVGAFSDTAKARTVINGDERIDTLELTIDEQCIDLIARHQPVARDLRLITTGMKINGELERIADLAVDIAERALELAGKPLLMPLVDIPRLAVVAEEMVHKAIAAFVNRDSALGRKVILSDTEANALRDAACSQLLNNFMLKDASTADRALPLVLVARYLERMCDHATNIAEDVIYLVEGRVARHQPPTEG